MVQFGNFLFSKEFEPDGYAKLLCHFNWLQGWASWDLEIKDSSFYGIPGNSYGAVSANPDVEGIFKGCAFFATGSTADYIQYDDDPALDITTNLTMECFFSAYKINGASQTIMVKANSYRISFADGSPNVSLSFTVYVGGNAKTLTIAVPESTFYGYWKHVRATYDGQFQRLYLNGVEIGNRAQTGLINTSTSAVFVGKKPDTNNQPFKGFIDELRISNIVRPFVGTNVFAGKTALAGKKVRGLLGGQSTLKQFLGSCHQGQSRLKKRIPLIFGGKTFLAHFHALAASGRSTLGKVLSSSAGGGSKLAYFVFEANPASMAMDSFRVVRMSLEELVNKGHFLYSPDYRVQNFAGAVQQEDSSSQGRYGLREKSFELDFIRETGMALEVAGYYFNSLKEIRAKIVFCTFLNGLHLEIGDHILVNYPLYDLTGELFTVTKVRFIGGSGQKRQMDLIEIEAMEG
jgi:hypothetical protein